MEKKHQNFLYFTGMVLGLTILISILFGLTYAFEAIAEKILGVEIPSPESLGGNALNWNVIYFGILIMLKTTSSPKDEYTLYGFVIVAITQLIRSSSLFFLKILPEIRWARTGDVLLFIGGVVMLALFVLIVMYHNEFLRKFTSPLKEEEA